MRATSIKIIKKACETSKPLKLFLTKLRIWYWLFIPALLDTFAVRSKLNFSLKIHCMCTLMFVLTLSYDLNVWLIIWVCYRKVEAVLVTAFVSFLSPAMLNPSRNSNRNKTSTRYKIEFWRVSTANQATLIKTCANLQIFNCFLPTKLWSVFSNTCPSPDIFICTYTHVHVHVRTNTTSITSSGICNLWAVLSTPESMNN